jgi:hypothetical protein
MSYIINSLINERFVCIAKDSDKFAHKRLGRNPKELQFVLGNISEQDKPAIFSSKTICQEVVNNNFGHCASDLIIEEYTNE